MMKNQRPKMNEMRQLPGSWRALRLSPNELVHYGSIAACFLYVGAARGYGMQFTKGTASLFFLAVVLVPSYVFLEIWKRSPSAGAGVLMAWGLVPAVALLLAPAVSWMVKLEAFALAVGSFVLLVTLLAIGPRWLGLFLNRRRD